MISQLLHASKKVEQEPFCINRIDVITELCPTAIELIFLRTNMKMKKYQIGILNKIGIQQNMFKIGLLISC